jgi:hypothetical protein
MSKVRLDDLVTRTHIGRRLHLSRAKVGAAISGEAFPPPIGRMGASPIWRWSEVRGWAEDARGTPNGPSDEAMHVAGIRDHFREAGFRLKITQLADGQWQAVRVVIGGPSAKGQAFRGLTRIEAAESALEWLSTHH